MVERCERRFGGWTGRGAGGGGHDERVVCVY